MTIFQKYQIRAKEHVPIKLVDVLLKHPSLLQFDTSISDNATKHNIHLAVEDAGFQQVILAY